MTRLVPIAACALIIGVSPALAARPLGSSSFAGRTDQGLPVTLATGPSTRTHLLGWSMEWQLTCSDGSSVTTGLSPRTFDGPLGTFRVPYLAVRPDGSFRLALAGPIGRSRIRVALAGRFTSPRTAQGWSEARVVTEAGVVCVASHARAGAAPTTVRWSVRRAGRA
jgi:hypothetical protein